MKHDYMVYSDESPTEIHHESCDDGPESYPTGDSTDAFVLSPHDYPVGDDEEFDRSCGCLDSLLGSDRHEEGEDA